MSDGIQKFELWENWARKRSPNRRESFSPRGKNVNRNFPGEPCSSYVSSSTFAGVVSLLGNSLIIKSRSFIQLVFKLNDKYSFLEYRNVTKLGGKPKTVSSVWDLESEWGGYRKLFSCATSRHQRPLRKIVSECIQYRLHTLLLRDLDTEWFSCCVLSPSLTCART